MTTNEEIASGIVEQHDGDWLIWLNSGLSPTSIKKAKSAIAQSIANALDAAQQRDPREDRANEMLKQLRALADQLRDSDVGFQTWARAIIAAATAADIVKAAG